MSTETKHDELLTLLLPLVDFMNVNGFGYFLVAGKDDIASQYVGGKTEYIPGMLESLFVKNPNIQENVAHIINELNKTK